MFRANIYSPEKLRPAISEAVADGIGIVAGYIGETVTTKELLVKLPLNANGSVNPDKVGFRKLDGMVELHVMAVPLQYATAATLGASYLRRGVSFINTSSNNPQVIRTTSAHENAHALGFVIPGSEQEDPATQSHCVDGNCVMHKKIMIIGSVGSGSPLVGSETAFSENDEVDSQFDFCLPCKIDLRNEGLAHINEIRYDRLMHGGTVE